ncbi:SERPINB2 [Symbiodinium pilosum]|uniref:SERPINB2 protein n=1 Tax=Symbiodinium pilosum TaxID=2952 RepID=A0A812VGR6_SYMPI|nr:SERPINB2 [Symbiodinium pilosum]
MRIRPDFVEAVQERFGAEAHELAGTDPEPINEWVKDKTLARIPTLFDSPLDPMTAMVLVNTVFFKGSWVTVFDVARTRRSEFRNFSSRLPCDMMYKKDRMMYMENDQLQAVRLPYSDEKTWATIILPKMEGPAEVASTLEQTWEDLNWELRGRTVELRLPRFRLSAGGSMKSALRQLGLKETLEPRGGFLKMSDDLSVHLSEVMHKATLEVNEEGTVAAAASGAVMKAKSIAPKPPVAMTVDRPFLFILSDGLGSVHFLGQIVVPELAGLEATLSEL